VTFTHPSWAGARSESYERLEFLGDAVLGLAIARTLYDRFPDADEGQLAKLRSQVVSGASCAVVGARLALADRLAATYVGPGGDELARLVDNPNVLAQLVESAIASVYLEFGFEVAAPAIVDAFAERIDYALTHRIDHKTELQEELARSGRTVSYAILDAHGPPHQRVFTAAVRSDGEQVAMGRGPSKKAAEQEAARVALSTLVSGVRAPEPPA